MFTWAVPSISSRGGSYWIGELASADDDTFTPPSGVERTVGHFYRFGDTRLDFGILGAQGTIPLAEFPDEIRITGSRSSGRTTQYIPLTPVGGTKTIDANNAGSVEVYYGPNGRGDLSETVWATLWRQHVAPEDTQITVTFIYN